MVLPEMRLLQAAIVLAEELSFSKAAERLHIGQPTLSKQIQELEGQLNLCLFMRSRQNVQLTDAGRHFVEGARNVILHAERTVISAVSAAHEAEEILNIGKSVYADPWLVTMLQSIHLSLFPGLKVKLWSNYSHELANQVARGQLDIALVIAIPDTPMLSFLNIAAFPAYIAMARKIPLATQEEIQLEDLQGMDWILPAAQVNPHLFGMIEKAATARNVRSSDRHYVMAAEEVPELLLAHKGVAFMTRDAAWRISSQEIAIRPLADESVKFVSRLAIRSDSNTRIVGEYLRAAGRKFSMTTQSPPADLPLTG